ncbi:unnamed protein product [Calypogeia fissa]
MLVSLFLSSPPETEADEQTQTTATVQRSAEDYCSQTLAERTGRERNARMLRLESVEFLPLSPRLDLLPGSPDNRAPGYTGIGLNGQPRDRAAPTTGHRAIRASG